jgi:hypothetical protein
MRPIKFGVLVNLWAAAVVRFGRRVMQGLCSAGTHQNKIHLTTVSADPNTKLHRNALSNTTKRLVRQEMIFSFINIFLWNLRNDLAVL